jgi:hypothetical protein
MVALSEVFTVVFIVTAALSLVFGAYIFRIKRSAQENWMFFIVAIALSVWSIGLGMALSAPTGAMSVIWRRVAAMGWGVFFSFLLHFVLILTGHKRTQNRWWIHLLIYLPAILNILVFAIPTQLNPMPFIMVETAFGWTNVAENNAWDIYYMICYLGMMATSLAIVWRWGHKSPDEKIKKQSRNILGTFITALARCRICWSMRCCR